MKANRAFEMIVSRGGLGPAFLADPERLDRVEVVSIEDGEVLLYWDLPAKQAVRLTRMLRSDLAGMEVAEFLRRWVGTDGVEAR